MVADGSGPVRVSMETRGAGEPLVLLHGVGANSSVWSLALPALTAARAVTTPDLPGFGASPPPEGRWTLEGVSDLLAVTLTARIDPPFDLLGSSLGGAVALTLAVRRPELVHRLILQAPAGFRPAPGPLPQLFAAAARPYLALRRAAGLRLADHPQARRVLLSGTVADGARLDACSARRLLGASAQAPSLQPALAAAAAADLGPQLQRLRAPLGLIWGGLDRVMPAHVAERILERHPDAPLELIGDAGHVPQLEAPDRFAAAVERLFSRLP
jgi:pimeloyl-ACP methyl ester carboxylesterase